MTDVTILDVPVQKSQNGTFAPSVGAEWVIIYSIRRNSSSTATADTAVTYGGVACSLVAGVAGRVQDQTSTTMWAINKTQFASRASDVINSSGGGGTLIMSVFSIQGSVRLTTPTISGSIISEDSLTNRSIALSRQIGGFTVHAQHWNLVGATVSMTPTRQSTYSDAGSAYSIAYITETSTGTAVSWTDANTTKRASYLAAHFQIIPPHVINSLNSGTNVLNANAVNTGPVTGFSPNAGTVGNLTLTNVSTTGGVTTFTIPWVKQGEVYPKFGTNQTLTLTDGVNSATFVAPFNFDSDTYAVRVVSSPDNVDIHKLGKKFSDAGHATANDDIIISFKNVLVVAADTSVTAPVVPVTTVVVLRVDTTGITYIHTVNAIAVGVDSGGGGGSTEPMPKTIVSAFNQAAGAAVISAPFQIEGLGDGLTATIGNGVIFYSIDSGLGFSAPTNEISTIQNLAFVRIHGTASTTPGEHVSFVLPIGGVDFTFTINTIASITQNRKPAMAIPSEKSGTLIGGANKYIELNSAFTHHQVTIYGRNTGQVTSLMRPILEDNESAAMNDDDFESIAGGLIDLSVSPSLRTFNIKDRRLTALWIKDNGTSPFKYYVKSWGRADS